MLLILLLTGVFGAAFFLFRGVQGRAALRSMTEIERRRVERDAAVDKGNRQTLPVKIRRTLIRNGYDGDLFPVVAAAGFGYLALFAGLHLAGLPYALAAGVALPTAAALALGAFAMAAKRTRQRFTQQLIELLDLLAGQMEAGYGTQKALRTIVPTLENPIRAEMTQALENARATKDLVAELSYLQEKYPSRGMGMFVSAMEIDREAGQAIGPALHQAANLLKKDFALAAEAKSELSQTRGEFLAVVGIIVVIAGKMLFWSDSGTTSAYTSGIGTVIIGAAAANMLFGVWRFLRLINKSRGDT